MINKQNWCCFYRNFQNGENLSNLGTNKMNKKSENIKGESKRTNPKRTIQKGEIKKANSNETKRTNPTSES